MFYSQFKKHGIFNTKIGRKYRNILKKGSSYKAMDLLEEFLNRYPNDNAFIENLDLSSSDWIIKKNFIKYLINNFFFLI